MHAAEKQLIALTKRPHLSALERQRAADPFIHLRTFLTALGNPEQKIPHYVHVTGTSGKGSTAAFLESILRANKHKTGLTVSPHITSIYERWQINGVPITPAKFKRVTKKLTVTFKHCAKNNQNFGLSFFEVCTALALFYFAEQKVTWAVLEVFNGGRVDPTNVIPRKDAAVITSIGLDHEHLLGNTRTKIAHEKSGIIKPGALVIAGEKNAKIKNLIKKISKTKRAHFVSTPNPQKILITRRGTQFVFNHEKYQVKTIGAHQARNAAIAIRATQALGLPISAIKQGLSRAQVHNRVEITPGHPQIILDTAHNPDKMTATVRALKALKIKNPLVLIELPAGKNIPAILKILATIKPRQVIATNSTANPYRASLPPTEALPLLNKAFSGATIEVISNPKKAFMKLKKTAKTHETILVTGSIYLTSQIQGLLTERPN